MKLNIFQKIAFLVCILVVLLICVYFVPYYDESIGSYHSSILDEGYGSMSYFRLLLYFGIPGSLVYFIHGYLSKLNDFGTKEYKRKAKKELYILFLFISVVIGSILYLYGSNEYTEIKKERLKGQISEINNSFEMLSEQLSKRPPFFYEIQKDNVDEYGIKIKKPWEQNYEVLEQDSEVPPLTKGYESIKKPVRKLNLDLSVYYKDLQKDIDNVLNEIFNVNFSVSRKMQLEKNIKQLIYNESSSEDLNKMIIDYIKVFSEDGIKKTKFELELKELKFYNESDIKFNVVFAFLGSFMLLYIIRPLFSIFKGMLQEVN